MNPAEAIPYASAVNTDDVVVVDLPLHQNSGLIFTGEPPRISQVTNSDHHKYTSSSVSSLVGYYFSSLKLPGLEVSQIADANQLRQLLAANQTVTRQVILTRQAPAAATTTDVWVGCLYRHDLPPGDLRDVLALEGFPPRIQHVPSDSPLAGRLHPGQCVDAVVIPAYQQDGDDDVVLTMQSTGFTASRVRAVLQETQHLVGRQLVVKDRADVLQTSTTGERGWFDLGTFGGGWFRPRRKVAKR